MKEDVYFYLDLTKDILKKKDIIKTIKFYIEEKNKVNIKGHYSLLVFQEEGNPIFITDKKDSGIIAKSIEENWKLRPKEQSYFENGLFYIFSYIAETVRKKSKFNRIIIISDTPSDLSDDYQEALFNLASKIKNFPTFIDIIRVSEKQERFFTDDVKLSLLASETRGGLFYVNNKKEFLDTVKKLIKTKQYVTTFTDRPDLIKISREDYLFYNRLAKSLKKTTETGKVCYFCQEEICPICSDVYDIPSVCGDCNASFHNCCITNYTINNNIGIPNILRCPNLSCDVLLKIDEDEIIEVSGDVEVSTVKEYMELEVLKEIPDAIYEQQDVTANTPIKEKTEPLHTHKEDLSEGEPIKTIQIGGFFGKVYTVKRVGDKIVYEKTTKTTFKPTPKTERKELEKQKELELTNNKKSERKRNRPSFVICKQCGTKINASIQLKCPNCGYST